MADIFFSLMKTEIFVCAFDRFTPKVMEAFCPFVTFIKSSIRNLEVTFGAGFTLDAHIKYLVCSCFHHLRNITKLRSIVSHSELEIVIHASISTAWLHLSELEVAANQKPAN